MTSVASACVFPFARGPSYYLSRCETWGRVRRLDWDGLRRRRSGGTDRQHRVAAVGNRALAGPVAGSRRAASDGDRALGAKDVYDLAVDRTSHNLLPFEFVMAACGILPYMVVVTLLRHVRLKHHKRRRPLS